jgi:hypothetical protein
VGLFTNSDWEIDGFLPARMLAAPRYRSLPSPYHYPYSYSPSTGIQAHPVSCILFV